MDREPCMSIFIQPIMQKAVRATTTDPVKVLFNSNNAESSTDVFSVSADYSVITRTKELGQLFCFAIMCCL